MKDQRNVRHRRVLLPSISFQPRDLWIGFFIGQEQQMLPAMLTTIQCFYLCLIPCVPIVFRLQRMYS